jgi:hypothetical protein
MGPRYLCLPQAFLHLRAATSATWPPSVEQWAQVERLSLSLKAPRLTLALVVLQDYSFYRH